MLLTPEEIKLEALSMSSDDRSELLVRLADSLDSDDAEAINQEWLAVARRRYAELRSGVAVAIPAEEVFAQIESRRASV